MTLLQEHQSFRQHLPELIDDHEGEFALCKEGRPVEFFCTYEAAYARGLDAFGLDTDFLIAQVDDEVPTAISVSWETGVMFDASTH